MRISIFALAFIALFIAGCTTAMPIPPQDPALGAEPRSMMLSEMAADLGWTYTTGPGPYEFTMKSRKGDLMTFRSNSELLIVNSLRFRQERDAVENQFGNDLLLPESTFNFICKRFGMHHMVRGPIRTAGADYRLAPITPGAAVEGPKIAVNGPLKGMKICVDAGHGGTDQGGAANGVIEKDIVLPVSLRLRDLLMEAGAVVLMTRTTDTYPDLDRRCEVANNGNVDLFVSVHANIAPNSDQVTGFEVFYKGGQVASSKLARALVLAMDRKTDSPNRGARVDPRGLRVLENTKMPAVLVELGFMSNNDEARRLSTKAYQDAMADALFEGISQYWGKGRASVSK